MQTYFHGFYTLAVQEKWEYFYFEAFDEPWKATVAPANGTVEAYFGLFDQNRVLKAEIGLAFDGENASAPPNNSSTTNSSSSGSSGSSGTSGTSGSGTASTPTPVPTSGDYTDTPSTSVAPSPTTHPKCAAV